VTSNYESIRDENRERYGTDIARIGPMLLADRYDDRTHFIFELLQNAEDALRRRGLWEGQRQVSFKLTEDALTLSHFGRPFDDDDVRGVCGIAESTKDEHSIGRFGIGFKSVYTFTDCPMIHSGDEDFEIRNYVQPSKADGTDREPEETLIVLPLKAEDETAKSEIMNGFKRLGPSSLLFLRSIEEINWSVRDDASGVYLRSKPETIGPNVHRINLIGQESGQDEVDEQWLVFHREVSSPEGKAVGRVEVAFSLRAEDGKSDVWRVVPVPTSPLVVFFPTAVETNLGFLVQGPYRTTPSRDNIPRNDSWNKYLVKETAELLIEALRWLRDQSMLDTFALSCLPLDPDKFPEGSMFSPMFDAVRVALFEEPLLPKFGGGHIAAAKAKLGRTKELRELFDPKQIATLFSGDVHGWLSGDITQDRMPELRHYLMQELEVTEIAPATIVPRLKLGFLEAQTDEWILKLYEYLNGQGATLRRSLETAPLIRLVDGSHVTAREGGKARAFLPSSFETGFPTVRPSVSATDESREFLISLGITEPDPVDDVVWNVLPTYQRDEVDEDESPYSRDIGRILAAYQSDSKLQREKLVAALRKTPFVMVLDAGDGTRYVSHPGEIYLATDRLKKLFSGVSNVMIVDDSYECLRGEPMRELLEACGALRCPRPVEAPDALSHVELRDIRIAAGHEDTSGIKDKVQDWTLDGFDDLMEILPKLAPEERAVRARLIWESLGDLEERRGRGVFDGLYSWTHYGSYKKDFPSAFVRRLNATAWVPDEDGDLQPPNQVIFDYLGWKANPFLLTQIAFKPPIIDQLAKEAGIDPDALDLLRKHGITSAADLMSRLGITNLVPENDVDEETEAEIDGAVTEDLDVYKDAEDLYGDDMPDIPDGAYDPDGDDDVGRSGSGATGGGSGNRGGSSGNGSNGKPGASKAERTGAGGNATNKTSGHQGKRTPGSNGGRPFISYLGSHPDDEGPDPDGLNQAKRMQIEATAIDKIIGFEPDLRRTVEGNKGFDLYEADGAGNVVRWVEVKSMTGSLKDRPVGMSRAQFDLALEKREAFWLYVVEHASEIEAARVVKIQDPAGRARTFTYDSGWLSIAETVPDA